jgi:hypothetical protein
MVIYNKNCRLSRGGYLWLLGNGRYYDTWEITVTGLDPATSRVTGRRSLLEERPSLRFNVQTPTDHRLSAPTNTDDGGTGKDSNMHAMHVHIYGPAQARDSGEIGPE